MINTELLQAYSQKVILASWDGEVRENAVEATRKIFREFTNTLIALGSDPPVSSIASAFTTCVRHLNALDMEDQFICTIEREDLCEELWKVGDICGVPESVDDWIDERDW